MWTAAEITFVFLCIVFGGMFLCWVIAALISSYVASRQESTARKRRAKNHRVGGAISP
jgi:hypothetical protein